MYTGKSDPLLTRRYISTFNYPYITYNHTYFDGFTVISEQINPYEEKIPLYGTDGAQNHPLSDPSMSQFIFLDTLYRVAEFTYESSV